MTTQVDLPRILWIIERTDSGEFGADNCAHCGAPGRYQIHFMGDDGLRHAAMAGCVQRFPMSPLAQEQAKLVTKAASARGLNGWDKTKMAAIEACGRQEISEADAIAVISEQNRQCRNWSQRRFSR